MAKAKKTTPTIIKDISTLKSLTRADLVGELALAQKEYFELSMKHSLGELKQPHLLTNTRRYIARVSTFMTTAI